MNFQQLAEKVPKWYHFPVYQSIWFGGKEIVKGGRDDMRKRMSLIRKEDIKGKTVVDIGCNLGAASFWAIENGAKGCAGIDVVPEGIDLANKIAEELKKIADEAEKEKMIKSAKYITGMTALIRLRNKVDSFRSK